MTTQTIRVNKSEVAYDVDFDALPSVSQAHVIAYGLRQILNDACAGSKTPADAKAAVEKRIENLKAGTLRASVGRTSDPVAKRAKFLAEQAVREGKIKLAGVPVTMKHPDIARIMAKVAEAKLDQAKREVAAAAKTEALDISL